MEVPVQAKRIYKFGLFLVDANEGKLVRKGLPVKIQEQPLRVLCLLLDHAGEIVSRDELRQTLWPQGTYVEFEGSLNAALKRLRFALGDDADNPTFIETVPRRGYRFIAPVQTKSPDLESTPVGQSDVRLPVERQPALKIIWTLAGAVVVLLVSGWFYTSKIRSRPAVSRKVIAVLPFSNEGAAPDLDYLRFAIPDDLVTDLTHTRSVTVRPFSSTSTYDTHSSDPATIGRQLQVTHVLAGSVLNERQDLQITLELVDVALNRAMWREQFSASPQDLLALHDKLAFGVAKGLLPAINISDASPEQIPSPRNEQALDLFLHSLTIPLDPEPNQLAIKKLEESVALEGTYAPAWGELGWRYYIDYHYGNGGGAAVTKALQAYKRESELDPSVPAVSTTIRVEQGDLNGAYDQAAEFLRQRPDVSLAHYAMSYVLRYAGVIEEAGKECDQALAIDPGFNVFRSCATPFILSGNYSHASRYIHLDENSGVAAMLRMFIALRTGNAAAALAESAVASDRGIQFASLAHSCLSEAPQAERQSSAAKLEGDSKLARDAEEVYRASEVLSVCGQTDAALRLLQRAINGNYCSYPAMDNDPLFERIRPRPEFQELRAAGVRCQENFVTHREQTAVTVQ